MQAGGEERAQPLPCLGPELGLAEADRIEAKREGAIADLVSGRRSRLTQGRTPVWQIRSCRPPKRCRVPWQHRAAAAAAVTA
jgi:hypothetical protein